jgi:hypothetical protein
LTIAQSGVPMTITDPKGGLVYGQSAGPELCPGYTVGQIKAPGALLANLNNYFNLSSLADTTVTTGNAACPYPIAGAIGGVGGATGYGDVGQNILFGPGQFNWDISIQKKTQVGGIREDGVLEFRTDFFNAFNHPQFSNPSTLTTTSSAFGSITTLSTGPRIIQFALKYSF